MRATPGARLRHVRQESAAFRSVVGDVSRESADIDTDSCTRRTPRARMTAISRRRWNGVMAAGSSSTSRIAGSLRMHPQRPSLRDRLAVWRVRLVYCLLPGPSSMCRWGPKWTGSFQIKDGRREVGLQILLFSTAFIRTDRPPATLHTVLTFHPRCSISFTNDESSSPTCCSNVLRFIAKQRRCVGRVMAT